MKNTKTNLKVKINITIKIENIPLLYKNYEKRVKNFISDVK
jgi:hypothetical protein